jgi:hypothetical protein
MENMYYKYEVNPIRKFLLFHTDNMQLLNYQTMILLNPKFSNGVNHLFVIPAKAGIQKFYQFVF